MKTIIKKTLVLFALCFAFSYSAYSQWRIVGDAVPQGEDALLVSSADNTKEFVYTGRLASQLFRISDGTKSYIHDCGDNDPLGDTIPLIEDLENNGSGLRIRYVGNDDFFRVTLIVSDQSLKITASLIEKPNNIYIMGGPFSNDAGGWKLQDAILLEVDKDNPFIFYYKGDIRYNNIGDERGSIKILKGKSWGSNYHPDAVGDVPLAQASSMRLGGTDNKWTIPADRSGDGYYELKIDMLKLTMTVEKFIPNIDLNPLPLAIFVAGDAVSCGWTNVTPLKLNQIQTGVYQWEGEFFVGDFKFIQKRNTWEKCYVATVANQSVAIDNEYSVVFEENYFVSGNDYKFLIPAPSAGIRTITVNLNTMKLVLGDVATAINNIKSDNGISYYTSKGELFVRSSSDNQMQLLVYSTDGRAVIQKTFVGDINVSLQKGSYIAFVNNKSAERVATLKTLIY